MDFSNLFMRLLELSPFVATLFFFLFTIWNTMQKKDEALTNATKEHQASMLQMQKENIMATNNSADAQRQLAGSIEQLSDSQAEVIKEIRELRSEKKVNGSRRPALVVDAKPAVA